MLKMKACDQAVTYDNPANIFRFSHVQLFHMFYTNLTCRATLPAPHAFYYFIYLNLCFL